jgi:toxin ParE1/3/4
MKLQVVFTPEARADLLELYDYIAENGGPIRALRYVEQIEEECMSLQTIPQRGTQRDDLRPGLRVMGFKRRTLIAFQVSSDRVAVLRILYGGRSAEKTFRQRDLYRGNR